MVFGIAMPPKKTTRLAGKEGETSKHSFSACLLRKRALRLHSLQGSSIRRALIFDQGEGPSVQMRSNQGDFTLVARSLRWDPFSKAPDASMPVRRLLGASSC